MQSFLELLSEVASTGSNSATPSESEVAVDSNWDWWFQGLRSCGFGDHLGLKGWHQQIQQDGFFDMLPKSFLRVGFFHPVLKYQSILP